MKLELDKDIVFNKKKNRFELIGFTDKTGNYGKKLTFNLLN